jgi:cell division protein FtsL
MTMAKLGILKEFWQFIKEEKVWWITPIVTVLLLLLAVIWLTEGSATVMPFIYQIF